MDKKNKNNDPEKNSDTNQEDLLKNTDGDENKEEITLEEKVKGLEDKLTRAFAEMENQRRRYEKEKEDAFEYGGFTFARDIR